MISSMKASQSLGRSRRRRRPDSHLIFRRIDLSLGKPAPPNPAEAIVMGDFNCEPDAPEYQVTVGVTPGEKGAGVVH